LEARAVIFFEAPHRIRRTLEQVGATLVGRHIFLARELSKKFEQLVVSPIKSQLTVSDLGEFTVIVGPSPGTSADPATIAGDVVALFGRLTNNVPLSDDEAVGIVSKVFSVDERVVKKAVKKARILVNNQKQSSA
jgi:16S rRNA C1402 (ribose-2'-O) methylase RsmI